MNEKTRTFLKLWLIPYLSLPVFHKIKKLFGDEITKIFSMSKDELINLKIDEKLATCITRKKDTLDDFLNKELELIKLNRIHCISFESSDYPEALKFIKYPPPFLFAKGDIKLLNTNSVAIVGSRFPTLYGKKIAEKLAEDLARNEITIISGLARGIDTYAHKGAIKSGKTIAVLGNGLGWIYPRENKKLYKEIEKDGLIITEFPFNMHPDKFNFPMRNRIISGLSQGLLVVEAAKKSGSLITANAALDQGKDVFAIPGEITNPNAFGTNQLIKDGAKIVIDAGDIIEEIFGLSKNFDIQQNQKSDKLKTLDEIELKIYEFITRAHKPSFEDIAQNIVGITNVNNLLAKLLNLELKGFIKELPGKFYCNEL